MPDELPRWATRIVGGWRPSSIAGARASAWATTVPGERAIQIWEGLRAATEPGWWPAVIGDGEDEERLEEASELALESPERILRAADDIDVSQLFRDWREELQGDDDDPLEDFDRTGPWPHDAEPSSSFSLPYDILSRRPRPTILALVPAWDGTEVTAALGWGDWNACPPPVKHVAVHRHWAARYGAELVGISGDVIEMRVTRPPTMREEAMDLAWDQYAYCADIVDQGTETVSRLAAGLLNGSTWYFWWD